MSGLTRLSRKSYFCGDIHTKLQSSVVSPVLSFAKRIVEISVQGYIEEHLANPHSSTTPIPASVNLLHDYKLILSLQSLHGDEHSFANRHHIENWVSQLSESAYWPVVKDLSYRSSEREQYAVFSDVAALAAVMQDAIITTFMTDATIVGTRL